MLREGTSGHEAFAEPTGGVLVVRKLCLPLRPTGR